MLCHVAAVKVPHKHHYIGDYIFWSFRIIEFISSYFENRILLKLVLRGVASVANVITGHEQTQLNRVSHFLFFGVFLTSEGCNYSERFDLSDVNIANFHY